MAVRIQLRRDTSANWISNNPVLREGEMGIETDTLKIKLGNGTSTWTQITNYMNLVPDGNLTIGDYVMVNDIGAAEGVVGLDINKNAIITGSSIILEGSTNNAYETTLTVTDPTADRTITFKNADGTVAFVADIPTSTDALSEGSTNKYFTDERAQDAVATALAAGTHTNISVSYNDAGNAISLTGSPTYTDEQAQDAVAAALAAGTHTNITVSYNDNANSISLTGAQTYNDEMARDAIGAALTGGTGITVTPNDNADTITVAVDNTIATKTYTDTAVSTGISNLIASAPSALDTLNELAAALGNDASFSTTVTNSIATKAPINSPTFTGTVSGITKSMVGLGNVDNTSDANKPVSNATQTALGLKANLADPTFTGTVVLPSTTSIGNVSATEIGYVDGVTSAIQTQLDAKSPLASPTFTGTPAAPTPTAGTNTTQLATTAFVKAAIDNLVNSAPGALDTLGEIAAQLATDESAVSALTTVVSSKAPLASPTFTGTVTLPSGTVSTSMIADSAITSAKIADGTIVDADINASAAIALSKLATDPLARANHTGTQTASTISDFNEAAQDAIGGILGSGLTYNDAGNAITVDSSVIQLRVSGVSDTEIGYLDGVTSAIQTQLDSKLSSTTASSTYLPLTGGTLSSDLTVTGNLTVNGTTTNLNSVNLVIEDKNIVLGDVTTPSDITANGGGITLNGSTNKTFNWVNSTSSWTSSEHIDLASGKVLKIAGTEVLSATAYTGKAATAGNADTVTNGVVTTGTYSNPSWITGLTWSKISSTPTTISGYGITNAVVTDAANTITAASSSTKPLIIKAASGQSVSLQEWCDSSNNINTSINASGNFSTTRAYLSEANVGPDYTTGTQGYLKLSTYTTTKPQLTVRAIASQTANMIEWQNSSGTLIAKIDASGNITAPSLTLSTTALATTSGGTGLSSYTTGDLLYASATNTLSKLSVGTNGQILTLSAGVPTWAAAPITLPSQTGNNGKYLTTDGTSASWASLVVPITTGTVTVNQNTAQDIDVTALSSFTSIEYMVSIKQGSKTRTSKVIMQTDGTSVDMTEFAITETGGTLSGVVVSATTASSNGKLQVTVTDALSTNATVKFSKVAL